MASDVSTTSNLDINQCSICLEDFTQPKFLDCFHTFCVECIRDLNQTSPGTVCCPLCQRQVQLPAGGVEQLTSNLYIININTDSNNSITTVSNIKKHERGTQTVESEIDCSKKTFYSECNMFGGFPVKNVEFHGVTCELHPGRYNTDKWGGTLGVRIKITEPSIPFVKSCDIDYDISLVNQKDTEYSVRQTGSCNLVLGENFNPIHLIKWADAFDEKNYFYNEKVDGSGQLSTKREIFQWDIDIKVKNKLMMNFNLI